jgi:hypothetical protein
MKFTALVLAGFLSLSVQAQPLQPAEWLALGYDEYATYHILKSSATFDRGTASVQFTFRTTLNTVSKKGVKMIIENKLVLCSPELVITTSQFQYDEKDKQVTMALKADIQKNPETKNHIVTEIIKLACGTKV